MKKLFVVFLTSFVVSSMNVFAQSGKGAINIVAFPEGVSITFMGQEYKNSVDCEAITAGEYKVMLNKAGYVPVDTVLDVKEGVTKYYNIVLSQKKTVVTESPVVKKKNSSSKSAQPKYYALAQVMLSDYYSQAGMFGMTFKGNGFYIKGVKTIFNKPDKGCYPGGSDTKVADSYKYTYAEALAGFLHEFNNTFTGYVGVGYGKRRVYQKYTDGEYYYNSPDYIDGAAADFGGILRLKNFCISAGVNTINFNVFGFCAGIGLTF